MKFSELIFDASGQSQKLTGVMQAYDTKDANDVRHSAPEQEYPFWVRRAPRADSATDEGDFYYWLVGEGGIILTTGLYFDSLMGPVNLRLPHKSDPSERDPEESQEDYDRRTNHGAY